MDNLSLLLARIGFGGLVISIVIFIIFIIKKKKLKNISLIMGAFLIVLITGIVLKPEEVKNTKPVAQNKSENSKVESNKVQTDNKKVDKDGLKKQIDAVVPDDLKGKSYSLDILTPTKNADKGYIVSIQVDNKKFLDESNCKQYANDFLLKLKNIEGVQSVDMNFIPEGKLLYGFKIDDFSSVKNKDKVLEYIKLQKLQ